MKRLAQPRHAVAAAILIVDLVACGGRGPGTRALPSRPSRPSLPSLAATVVEPPAHAVVRARARVAQDNACVFEAVTLFSDGSLERAFSYPSSVGGPTTTRPDVAGPWFVVDRGPAGDGLKTLARCEQGVARIVARFDGDAQLFDASPRVTGRRISVVSAGEQAASPTVDGAEADASATFLAEGRLVLEFSAELARLRRVGGAVLVERPMRDAFGYGCAWQVPWELGDAIALLYGTSDHAAEVAIRSATDGSEVMTKKLPFRPCGVVLARSPTAPRLAFASGLLLYELDLRSGAWTKRFERAGSMVPYAPDLRYAADGRSVCLDGEEFPARPGNHCSGLPTTPPIPKGMSVPRAFAARQLPVASSADGLTAYRVLYRTSSVVESKADYLLEVLRSSPTGWSSSLIDLGSREWEGNGVALEVDAERHRFDVVVGDARRAATFAFALETGKDIEVLNGLREPPSPEETWLGIDLHAATTEEGRALGDGRRPLLRVSPHACVGVEDSAPGDMRLLFPAKSSTARLIAVGQGFVLVEGEKGGENIDGVGPVEVTCADPTRCDASSAARLRALVASCESRPR